MLGAALEFQLILLLEINMRLPQVALLETQLATSQTEHAAVVAQQEKAMETQLATSQTEHAAVVAEKEKEANDAKTLARNFIEKCTQLGKQAAQKEQETLAAEARA